MVDGYFFKLAIWFTKNNEHSTTSKDFNSYRLIAGNKYLNKPQYIQNMFPLNWEKHSKFFN